jgi:hypothetical protein
VFNKDAEKIGVPNKTLYALVAVSAAVGLGIQLERSDVGE